MNDLKKLIREVPDYPKPGILFYDLTTLLKDKQGFHLLIDRLCEHYKGHTIDVVAGVEEQGSLFFSPPPSLLVVGPFCLVQTNKHPPDKTHSTTLSHYITY